MNSFRKTIHCTTQAQIKRSLNAWAEMKANHGGSAIYLSKIKNHVLIIENAIKIARSGSMHIGECVLSKKVEDHCPILAMAPAWLPSLHDPCGPRTKNAQPFLLAIPDPSSTKTKRRPQEVP